VRKLATSVAGELHLQLGPAFRALILSSCADVSSTTSLLERAFDENPFDPAASKMERPRECVVLQSSHATGSNGEATAASVLLDLPKMDLPAALSSDCIEKMVRFFFCSYSLRYFHFFLTQLSFELDTHRDPKKGRTLGNCESRRWMRSSRR
jgi:hypothetical protein